MSKFRIKLKLQALELEVEGAREDAAQISRNIGQQMAALLAPVEAIVDGEPIEANRNGNAALIAPIDVTPRKTRRRRNGVSVSTPDDNSGPIDFRHQPEKYGNPKQEWRTAEKCLWLLYVVKEITGMGELSARSIVDTFNKHFRQSGAVTTSNVARDLGRLKAKDKPTPLGEDTTKSPHLWYLTEEGRKRAQALVGEALGKSG